MVKFIFELKSAGYDLIPTIGIGIAEPHGQLKNMAYVAGLGLPVDPSNAVTKLHLY
jgi:hypothetical protein